MIVSCILGCPVALPTVFPMELIMVEMAEVSRLTASGSWRYSFKTASKGRFKGRAIFNLTARQLLKISAYLESSQSALFKNSSVRIFNAITQPSQQNLSGLL